VQTLVDLGLTVLQAKVYIALAKSGTSTGRTTAKTAKVASQDIYRVLSELQEKGLVEKIISKPNKYRPIQIEEGLPILLQRRNKQTIEIKNSINEIVKNFQSIDKIEDDNEKCQFVCVPQKEIIEKKIRNGFETAQTSVDLSSEVQCSMEGAERSHDIILKSVKRGVKFRELIDLSQGRCQESRAFSTLRRNPAYQTRFFCSTFPVKLQIKDRQEVLISVKNAASNLDTPYLWSNNPCLVQVIQQWYDIMWEKCESRMPKGAAEIFESGVVM
jgi:sugar-specific transcriptional regulator TrmB